MPLPPPSAPHHRDEPWGGRSGSASLTPVWLRFREGARGSTPLNPPPFQSCPPFGGAGQHPATCLPGMGVPCPPLLMFSCLALALTAMASPSPASPSPHPVRAFLLLLCRWTLPSHPQKPRWTRTLQSSWATSWRRPGSSWRATARGRGAPCTFNLRFRFMRSSFCAWQGGASWAQSVGG